MTEPDSHPLEDRLSAERPVPAPEFRGGLRRSLLSDGAPPGRPSTLALQIVLYASGGVALLVAVLLAS